ncbi:hypothetical protein Fmac_027200 [Flemingia macrophylla]|uniref:RecA family profile 2 domain-containing protein n=1 Tax=Flemingia macrophylla TaxID=520843 RepID=A0ABD1LHB3_9FABA
MGPHGHMTASQVGELSLHLPSLPCVALPCLVLHLHLAFPRLSLHFHLTLPRLTLHLASPCPPPFTLASPSSFALHPLLLSSSSLTFASSSKNNSFRYSTTPSTFAAPTPHRSFAHGRCAYAAHLVVLAPLVVTTPASSTNTHCACLALPLSAESYGAYAAQLIASPLPTLIVLVSPTHPCRSCPAPSLLAESRGPVSCYMPLDPEYVECVLKVRSKISSFGGFSGPAKVTCGGNALKFYASVWLNIRRIGLVKKGEESKRSCFLKLDAIKNAIADILTGLSKKPVTLSWEDNNCSTMEISGLKIGWGQVIDESSCLD